MRGVAPLQWPVDLAEAGIDFDPRRGFSIREGRLRHHNGVLTCKALGQEEGKESDDDDSEIFTLIFSFAPPSLPPPGNGGGGGDDDDDVIFFPLPLPTVEEPFQDQWEVGKTRRISCSVTLPKEDEPVGGARPAILVSAAAALVVVDDDGVVQSQDLNLLSHFLPLQLMRAKKSCLNEGTHLT